MAWRRGASEQFHALGRIAASAGEPSDENRREQIVREGVLRRAVSEGLINEHDLPSWQRHAEADLWGVVELLNDMEAARRGNSNGAVAAAAPRRDDGERLIAGAVQQGKFRAERADFWRRRYAENPQQTAALIEALTPVLAASGGQRKTDEASAIGSVHPQAALRLGYHVARPNPLGENLPGRVQVPPPPRRVNVIGDRS